MKNNITNAFVTFAKKCAEITSYDWDNEFKKIKKINEKGLQSYIKSNIDIINADKDTLLKLGFIPFSVDNKEYMLVPLYIYDIIPDGTKFISIFGEIKTKGVDYIDNAVRLGCIAYGIYKES